MKNLLTSFSLLLCFMSPILAQKLSVGPHIGGGAAFLSNLSETHHDVWGAGTVVAASMGLGLEARLGQHLALDIAINYSRKGNERYALQNTYHYLNLPISIQAKPFKDKGFYIKAGLYGARLIGQQKSINGKNREIFDIYLLEYSPVKRFDFGLVYGLGHSIRLSPKLSIKFEILAEQGMVDVFKRPAPDNPIYNRSFIGTFGLLKDIK